LQVYQAGDATFHWYPNLPGQRIDGWGAIAVSLTNPATAPSHHAPRLTGTVSNLLAESYAQPGVNHPFPLAEGVLQLNGPIDIDGHAAIQKSYRIRSGPAPYELRDIWIPVNNDVYLVCILTQWTNADDLAFETAADAMLQSLEIK
jgi:hypothetical protein